MKQGIHPNYHTITIVMTDGTKYETRSTWGKEGDVLQLDVDPKTHPAWVGGVNLRKTGQMEKFTNKFAFLDKTPNAAPAAKKDAKVEDKAAKPEEKAAKPEEKTASAQSEAPKAAKKKEAKPAEDKKD